MSNVVSVLILCVYLSQSWQMTCLVLVSFYFWLLYCMYGLLVTPLESSNITYIHNISVILLTYS